MIGSGRLHPFDVVLALRLLRPVGTLVEIAHELSVVPSQVHAALRRLEFAGLIRPGTRATNRHALAEFLEFGVRYAFPARVGNEAVGVPTAHSAALLSAHISAVDAFVWPSPRAVGAIRGYAVQPLYAGAVGLREKSPETYQLVALVDALRVGNARERSLARLHLKDALSPGSAAA